jgi:acetamidase/formamidase
MKKLPLGPLYYEFSRHYEPRLVVEPGETVLVETEDAFSGLIRTDADRRDKSKMPYSNALSGPILIEGAEPGDVVSVTIIEIQPLNGRCATRTAEPRQLCEWLGTDCPHGTHVSAIRDGTIFWTDELTIPYAPMLGCIGTAPSWGSPTSGPPGDHGGNLDLIEICPGNKVYLPVFVSGAYLFLGDAHAAQGQGELSATGLEMASQALVKVELVKSKKLLGPRIESPAEIMAVASGCPMERSVAQAYASLILWIEDEFGWDRWKAYDLLTHVGRLSVGYYASGTVAAKLEKRYLNRSSIV